MEKLSIILASIVLFLNSCHKENNNNNNNNAEFEFTIQGNAEYGGGIELSLYIPSQGLDNRIKSIVKNGEYFFRGKSANIEKAEIRFEENMLDESSSYSYISVFIEPDTTRLDFTISGDSLQRYSQNRIVSQGVNNKFYYDVYPLYWKHASWTMFSDEIKMDSMHQFVYPKVRKNAIRAYDSLFSNMMFPEVALSFLNATLQDNGPFQLDKLTKGEIEKIVEFFNKIDTSLSRTPAFRIVNNKIKKLRLLKSNDSFNDFLLTDIDDKKVRLSDVIKNNKITVLYFWWSGCLPCRKFNKETTFEKYSLLKENEIEIVSISVDESNQRWAKASRKDSISWINLYAGAVSDIELDYDVVVFPTKIIFDEDFNVIDFNFKDASELLRLVEK